jgi:hypothetical protein
MDVWTYEVGAALNIGPEMAYGNRSSKSRQLLLSWLIKYTISTERSFIERHSLKVRVLWDISLCSLVVADRGFRGAYSLHQGDETSVCFHETTRRCIQESCHLYVRRRENLISHFLGSLFGIVHSSISVLVIAVIFKIVIKWFRSYVHEISNIWNINGLHSTLKSRMPRFSPIHYSSLFSDW